MKRPALRLFYEGVTAGTDHESALHHPLMVKGHDICNIGLAIATGACTTAPHRFYRHYLKRKKEDRVL